MGKLWPSKWYCVGWAILGYVVLLSGVVSGNVVTIVVGIVYTSVATSAFLMYYVESEHRVKRALEVVFAMIAFGVIVYGYIVTGSLILGVITLFIVAMFFVAFILSYLLPKIRSKSSERGVV